MVAEHACTWPLRRLLVGVLLALGGALLAAPTTMAADANFAGASDDGGVVFFTSEEKLVFGDTDNRVDIYERSFDASFGKFVTRQVSTGPTGGNSAYGAQYVGASVDGSKVFFATEESLVDPDDDLSEDIYVRNLDDGSTELVSLGDATCVAAGCGNASEDASFTKGGVFESGEKVFFRSAEKLEADDEDTFSDLYVRDMAAERTRLVSAGDPDCVAGGCGNGNYSSSFRGVSADGGTVFFTTEEPLVGDDEDSLLDIYSRNLSTEVTTLVSDVGDAGQCPVSADCSASYGGISTDGSHLYFETNERLAPEDDDVVQDVYDVTAGTATLVSVGPAGNNGSDSAVFAGATVDGRLFFETSEKLVAADDDEVSDVYERSGAFTTLVSTGPTGGNGDSPASLLWLSPDGSTADVLFGTDEALTSEDTDEMQDVYAHSGSGTVLRTVGNGLFNAGFAAASDDGSRIFIVTAEQLVVADKDSAPDAYEISDGAVTLVSTGPLAGKASIAAGVPKGGVAADGSHVFFTTQEAVTEGDLDADLDVYDFSEGGTLLASVGNSAPLGPPTPSQLATDPASPNDSLSPRVKGLAQAGSGIKIYTTDDCSGAPVKTGSAAEFNGGGISVAVAAGSTTGFRATATDQNGDTSPCSAEVVYVQRNQQPPSPEGGDGDNGSGEAEAGPTRTGGTTTEGKTGGGKNGGKGVVYVTPQTRITFAPAGITRVRRPVFRFTDSTEQPGSSFRCKLDRRPWGPCGSPLRLKKLTTGAHLLQVRAVNAVGTVDPLPAKRRFKVMAGR
jgi:hypothetical protein